MKLKFKRYWQLFWYFRKLQLMRTLEYRGDFFFWSLIAVMWTVFNFFFFGLIINVGGPLAGWSLHQMYLLISVFTILDAFTWSFFYHNMRLYTRQVFNGEFNQHLLRPINPQFLLMTFENSYTNSFRFVIGLGMMIWSINQLEISLTWPRILGFLVLCLVSLTFIYFIWFILSTIAFYVDRLDNINEIIPATRRIWQLPRSVYTGISSLIFTIILPLGLISSLPTEVLLGQISWFHLGYYVVFTFFTVVAARIFFKISIKKYTGVAN